jgi:AhpD family alkylhydroperoxidase
MSGFDSVDLMKRINDNLGPFRKAQTETMLGFGHMAKAAMAEGALTAKHKELIAVAIGITQHCGGCIAFHVKALHRLGCIRAEFEEAMGVCVYMGGGPGLMNVAEALAAWDAMAPAATN